MLWNTHLKLGFLYFYLLKLATLFFLTQGHTQLLVTMNFAIIMHDSYGYAFLNPIFLHNLCILIFFSTEGESRDISIIINLMKKVHILHEKYSELLQNTHRRKLAKYLKYIGFDNLAYSLCPQVDSKENIAWQSCMCMCEIFCAMFSRIKIY